MTMAGTEEGLSVSTEDDEEYHLETSYDLASVSLREARLLTAPMLEEAVGITGLTGDTDLEDLTSDDSVTWSTNQMIMVVLLGISGILLLRFTYAAVVQSRRQAAAAAKRQMTGMERQRNEKETEDCMDGRIQRGGPAFIRMCEPECSYSGGGGSGRTSDCGDQPCRGGYYGEIGY